MRALLAAIILCALLPSLQADPLPILVNGSGTEGEEKPVGWELYVPDGEDKMAAEIVRDTSVFESEPASVGLITFSLTTAHASQHLKNLTPGVKNKISGVLRMDAEEEEWATVALQIMDSESKQIEWRVIGTARPDGEWERIDTDFEIEEGQKVNLHLSFRGVGKAWLDSMEVTPLK